MYYVALKRLKARMVEKDMTAEDLSRLLGLSVNSIYRRLNGRSPFTIDEVHIICEELGLTELGIKRTFFAEK